MIKDFVFFIREFQGEPCLYVKNTLTEESRLLIQPCALNYELDLDEIAEILNRVLRNLQPRPMIK